MQNLSFINAQLDSGANQLINQFEKDLQQDYILPINYLQTLESSWDAKLPELKH